MAKLLKLLVVLAILNAVARCGFAAWNHYRLEDAAQQLIQLGSAASTEELHAQILIKAKDLELPLSAQQLTVDRDSTRTVAAAAYTQPVELFPRFTYRIPFSFRVETLIIVGATPTRRR